MTLYPKFQNICLRLKKHMAVKWRHSQGSEPSSL